MRGFLVFCGLGLMASTVSAQEKPPEVAGFVKQLGSTFDVEKGAAGLGNLGYKGLGAMPDLATALKKGKFQGERTAIANAMSKILSATRTEEATLRAQLKETKNPKERASLNVKLDQINKSLLSSAKDLADALTNVVKFNDDQLAVIKAIGAAGPSGASASMALGDFLKANAFAKVKVEACKVLGDLGPAARDAIPALETASKTGFLEVRDAAKDALSKVKK